MNQKPNSDGESRTQPLIADCSIAWRKAGGRVISSWSASPAVGMPLLIHHVLTGV
jgi:hypothetical protein